MVARLENIEHSTIIRSKNSNDVDPGLISIVIPTLYRPKGLETAFRSAACQNVTGFNIEIIVADNSPDASAKNQANELFKNTDTKAKYISVPLPGVANVRNAALNVSEGQFIAFLDDDQEATQNWLSSMMNQIDKDNSYAVFSRIEGRSALPHKNFLPKLAFFSRRHDNKPSGLSKKFYGCGGSLINLSLIASELMYFDPARNQTGGEDDAFFSAIQQSGGFFSWSKEALVYEDVPPHRMSKRYICQRSFAFGQGPSRLCLELDSYSISKLITWMIIGAIQMVVYAPLAVLTMPFENAMHMKYLRKCCEGAGKFFWQEVFRQKLYGQAAVEKIHRKRSKKLIKFKS